MHALAPLSLLTYAGLLFADPSLSMPAGSPELYTVCDSSPMGAFGSALAMNSEYLIVGSALEGRAGLYSAGSGALLFELQPGPGAAAVRFGASVALNDRVAAISAPGPSGGGGRGAVYVYALADGQLLARLMPAGGSAGDAFGAAIALTNERLLATTDGSTAALLFDLPSRTEIATLRPAAGGNPTSITDVALSLDVAVLGTPQFKALGAAHVFDAATGTPQDVLTPTRPQLGDGFGFSVAASGSTVCVGAIFDDDNGPFAGAAYVFDARGNQLLKLAPDDGATGDQFGNRVAFDGDHIASASLADDNQEIGLNSGAGYVFRSRDGQQLAKLLQRAGQPGDNLGSLLCAGGGRVAFTSRGQATCLTGNTVVAFDLP